MNENSRTKLVSKRDSDKQNLDDNQIESDSSWLSRAKRSLSSFFTKTDEKVVEKRETSDANNSQDNLEVLRREFKAPSIRRRRQSEDDEDDDEENEIASGDHETTTDSFLDPITPLPPVKDDKYCKISFNFILATICWFKFYSIVRLKLHVNEMWRDQFKDKSSEEFRDFASTLKKAIEDIYDDKNTESTTIMAQIVEIR